jgi:hypothetical protein
MSSEFERLLSVAYTLNKFHLQQKMNLERCKSSYKTAVAALVAGAPQTSVSATEQAQIAALPASQADGILSKMIYNNSNQAGVAGVEVVLKLQEQLLQVANIKAHTIKFMQLFLL